MTITEHEAIAFLSKHQPMPSDGQLDDETIDIYDAARRLFRERRNDACVPLFLNSFGDGDGLGVYQLIGGTLRNQDENAVRSGLLGSLASPHRSVRYWSAQIAAEFPDDALVVPLVRLLEDASADTRAAAIDALAAIGTEAALTALEKHQSGEKDPEVLQALEEALAELGAK